MRISKIILLAVISILGCQDSSLKSKADEELISSLLSSNEIIDDINQRSILSFDNMLVRVMYHASLTVHVVLSGTPEKSP